MKHVLAADIGGTNIRLALIEENGTIIDEIRSRAELSRHSLRSQHNAELHVINTLTEIIAPFAELHGINRIGMGFPGFFHSQSGRLASSPNLPLLQDFALTERLAEALGIAVAVENDALCAAIGEHHYGAGKGQNNLLHITLGTGIGSGLILNSMPYSGEHGMAMEFGHLCIEHHDGLLCGCGNHGCVEAYASATAVIRRYSEKSGEQHDAKAIFALAQAGNTTAQAVLHEAGSYLGMAIAEAVKLLDVSTITISGGLSGAWDILHPALMKELNANLIPPLKGQEIVLRSTLNDNAGLLGAATIALGI